MNLRNRLPFFLAYAQKPRKPTFLEYIETDGSSYIDTGVIPSNNMEIEAGVMFSVVQDTNLSIIASRDGEKRYQPIGVYQNKWSVSIGTEYDANGSSVSANTKYDLRSVVSNGDSISLYSGNTLVSSLTSSGGVPTNSLYLFARNYSSVDSYVSGRLYYCKIWDNGVLIQDLRPALDPNGKVCMYDTVTKKYFYNAGTGELKAGGRFVESIVFDGNSWIDTGYIPSSNTRVVGSAVFTQWNNGLANYVFGVFGDNSNFGFNIGSSRNFFNVPWETSAGVNDQTKGIVPEVNIKYNFDISKEGCYINDVEYLDASKFTATFQAQKTMYVGWSNGTSAKQMIGEMMSIQIFESSELAQDLRPYVDGDGVACFKDIMTDTLFYNKGTGTLTYTEYEPLEFIYLDGNQYIDTLLLHETCTIETAVKYEAGHSRRMLTGWSGAGSYWGMMSNSNLEVSGSGTTETDLTDYTVINIALDNENLLFTVTADGITKTATAVYADSTYTIGCTVPSSVNKVIGNVYYMKARNANGVLVRDMIPVKRSDGVKCMYDRVENKYYELINK